MIPHVLAVVPARAGSKGLPRKNVLPLAGRPMIAHTLEHALKANRIDAIVVTTDFPEAAEVARAMGIRVVDRPPELATDTATVDSAVRHAVLAYEATQQAVSHVAILYPNIPVRAPGIIDRAICHLIETGADSVRTVAPVSKQHPDWLHRLEGDRMIQYRKNSVYRRQDLEPVFYHDGAVLAVTREAMFLVSDDDHHAFMGKDRRAVVQEPEATVDVDSQLDLHIAETMLRDETMSRLREQGVSTEPTQAGQPRLK